MREAILAALKHAPSFAVAIDPEGEWVAVYGESMDKQDGSHEKLAESLSKTLGTTAVAVLIHDSDVLMLTGLRNGRREASYNSSPRYFEGGLSKPEIKGEEFWNGLLGPSGSPSKLKAALRSEEQFAEYALAQIATLFGWNESLATANYKDLEDLAEAEQIDVVRTEPAWTLPPPGRGLRRGSLVDPADAPVSLACYEMGWTVDLFVGKQASNHLAVESCGRESRGLEIRLSGPAIESGSVEPVRATLEAIHEPGLTLPFVRSGPGAFVVSAPEFEIPNRADVPMIRISLELRGVTECMSSLRCDCVPTANPAGRSSLAGRVRVSHELPMSQLLDGYVTPSSRTPS